MGDVEMAYDIYAPLENFYWSGKEFQFGPDVWISPVQELPDLSGFRKRLSEDEWERATETQHWLHIEWDGVNDQEPNGTSNLALLSLWLAKQTKTQITLRFQVERPPGTQTTRSRILDRFAWVHEPANPDFTNDELAAAAGFYQTLVAIYRTRGRLNNALLLTVSGCWSHLWQTALICHAAAAEAMLTYSTGRGITRRLATSFACLTEAGKQDRDAAFREFVALYSIRSDIMHGRTHNIPVPDRLPTLVRFQSALRSLWKQISASPQLVAILEDTDLRREAHFAALQQGYQPPP